MPGSAYRSLQNPQLYERLRADGYSKEEAARISNAKTPGHTVKRPSGAKRGRKRS